MLDKEFFRGLNPTQMPRELFCDKVERVCKLMRQKYQPNETHFITHSWTKESELNALCHKEGISSRVPKKILFGNVEEVEQVEQEKQTKLKL